MSTSWTIRMAGEADDAPVGELLVTSFVATYARKMPEVVVTERRKAELRSVADKRKVARVWVAEAGGAIVGTVALWPWGAAGSEAFIGGAADLRHLAVALAFKGSGLAAALLDEAEAEAGRLGSTAVCLHVRRGAHGIKRMYQARGYVARPEGDLDLSPEIYLEALALDLPVAPAAGGVGLGDPHR